jgi:hypothetical protein
MTTIWANCHNVWGKKPPGLERLNSWVLQCVKYSSNMILPISIDSFLYSDRKRWGAKRLYPTCIQAQHMVDASDFAWNIQSHNLTWHHKYRPNSFNPNNKLLDNILKGEMVDGSFNDLFNPNFILGVFSIKQQQALDPTQWLKIQKFQVFLKDSESVIQIQKNLLRLSMSRGRGKSFWVIPCHCFMITSRVVNCNVLSVSSSVAESYSYWVSVERIGRNSLLRIQRATLGKLGNNSDVCSLVSSSCLCLWWHSGKIKSFTFTKAMPLIWPGTTQSWTLELELGVQNFTISIGVRS